MIIESLVSGIGGLTGRFDPRLQRRDYPAELTGWQASLGQQYSGINAWAPMMAKLSGKTLLGGKGGKAVGYVGLAQMLQPELAKMNAAEETSNYDNILANSENYRQAQRSVSPEFWSGLAQLLAGTQADYGAGYDLNPTERRNLLQSYRGAMASRGMGYSPTAAAGEAVALSQSGSALRNQRMSNLMRVLQMYGAVMPQVAAPGSRSMNTAQTALGTSLGSAIDPVQFANPNASAQYWDTVNTNNNMANYQEIAKRNNRKEAWSNMGKVGDDILMMAAGGGMGSFGGALNSVTGGSKGLGMG